MEKAIEYKFENNTLRLNQSDKYEKIFQDQRSGTYPVVRGTFEFGDLRSSVAVILPTPDRSLEMLAIHHGAAIAGSVNTSSLGIEYIIANIVSNPNIRNIIVYGYDSPSFHPGQSLILLKENGIDDQGFIIGTEDKWGARITHIEQNIVKCFRKQIVNVIDLLGEDDSTFLSKVVQAAIQEPQKAQRLITRRGNKYLLYDPGPLNNEPCYPAIAVGKPGSLIDRVRDPLCSLIVANDISQAYNLLWATVRADGNEVKSQFGLTKELLNCTVHIKHPLENFLALIGDGAIQINNERGSNYMPQDAPVNKLMLEDFLNKYFETLITPEKMVPAFNRVRKRYELQPNAKSKYTYGERLCAYKYRDETGELRTRNNLQVITQALLNSIKTKANTRRCIVSLIDPVLDLTIDLQDLDPPCINTLVFNPRQIERNKWIIYGTMIMRSHDVRRAFIANVYAFARLTDFVCSKLNEMLYELGTKVEMGPTTIFFVSAHEYISNL